MPEKRPRQTTPRTKAPQQEIPKVEVPPLPPPHKITVDEIPPLSLNLSDEIHEDMTDEQLVVAFRSLRKRLDDEKKYRRTTTFALVLVVFLVALAGIGLFLFNKTRLDDRVAQNRNGCNRGNELRQQIRDIGTKINARQDNFARQLR